MDMALCWDTSKNVPSLARAVSPVEPENMTAKFHVVYFYHSFANIIIILDIMIFCKSAFQIKLDFSGKCSYRCNELAQLS